MHITLGFASHKVILREELWVIRGEEQQNPEIVCSSHKEKSTENTVNLKRRKEGSWIMLEQ